MHSNIIQNWSKQPPTPPWVTLLIILLCLLLTAAYNLVDQQQKFTLMVYLGYNPATVNDMFQQGPSFWWSHSSLSLVSSMFLHGSWLHVLGNMAFLLIFGLPVERHMGTWGFLAVYVLGGALTNAVVSVGVPKEATPIIGASGGVSVIIGTYLGLFPRGRIGLIVPLGLYFQFARLPALLVIGSWFTLQLLYTMFGPILNTAVAWLTHVAGFAIGLCAALLVRAVRTIRRK